MESEIFAKLLEERKPEYLNESLDAIDRLYAKLEEFDTNIRNGDFGPMAAFWQSYIDMVQVLLDFIKAIRIGDWDLHLQTCEQMLVWMHAYDRTNYSRHFTYYWASQQKLEIRFQSINQEFEFLYQTISWKIHYVTSGPGY